MLVSLTELVIKPFPAVGHAHLARITLVKAHAFEHQGAGALDAFDQAHASRIGSYNRAGDGQQTGISGCNLLPSSSSASDCISSNDSCGAEKYHDIQLFTFTAVARKKSIAFGRGSMISTG